MMDAFELALGEASEQGSQMWHDIRSGRFTSSEMYKLMESGTREMTDAELKARPKTGKGSKAKLIEDPNVMSKATITYIRTKVAETLTGQCAEQVNSAATRWGDDFEAIAAQFFKDKTGMDFEILSFVPFGQHAGGSPDRKILGKNEILEVKCPYNSANQIDYLMLTDQWDLKNAYPEHYWQCMSNLLFTDSEVCHFVTYDHRMIEDKNKMFYLEIKPIAEDIDRIIVKLEAAIKEKLYLLDNINKQKSTYQHLKP